MEFSFGIVKFTIHSGVMSLVWMFIENKAKIFLRKYINTYYGIWAQAFDPGPLSRQQEGRRICPAG